MLLRKPSALGVTVTPGAFANCVVEQSPSAADGRLLMMREAKAIFRPYKRIDTHISQTDAALQVIGAQIRNRVRAEEEQWSGIGL